jgi:hypothetical protein
MNNGWTNYGDVNPWHGQLWIKDAYADSTEDSAECVEIISPCDFEALADNQLLIMTGSLYIPLHDTEAMKQRLDVIGKTPSLANWVDYALASHAYGGIEKDSETVAQFSKEVGDSGSYRHYVDPMESDIVLHGNKTALAYIEDNFLN